MNAVVNSHNEWDPLEEVIVGILDGACDLPWEIGKNLQAKDTSVWRNGRRC